jgi:guanosine-3',5'-bis(diphosphate) 3'-pyrophosphohydrolase
MYSPQQQDTFQKAIIFLVDNINRTGHNPKPVILHSIRVAMYLYAFRYPSEIVISAYLHDLLEDTECTVDEIRSSFGDTVASTVMALSFDISISDREQRNKKEIEQAVAFGKSAVLVKASDLLDNSNYYHLAGKELQPLLLKKLGYFIEQSEQILKSEPVWQDLLDREKKLLETLS